jgi:hypothetical protein
MYDTVLEERREKREIEIRNEEVYSQAGAWEQD